MSDEIVVTGRLAELEAIIERGMPTFVAIGQALAEIRDNRLYKATHHSFDLYLADRWGFSRQRASQLIAAAKLSTTVDSSNERQARAKRLPSPRREPVVVDAIAQPVEPGEADVTEEDGHAEVRAEGTAGALPREDGVRDPDPLRDAGWADGVQPDTGTPRPAPERQGGVAEGETQALGEDEPDDEEPADIVLSVSWRDGSMLIDANDAITDEHWRELRDWIDQCVLGVNEEVRGAADALSTPQAHPDPDPLASPGRNELIDAIDDRIARLSVKERAKWCRVHRVREGNGEIAAFLKRCSDRELTTALEQLGG